MEELLDLLIESRAADDDLVELTAKGIAHLLTDFVAQFLCNHGHVHEQADGIVLQFGEHALADDFLDHEGHADDNFGLDFAEGLRNNCRARNAREEIDVAARKEFKDEFEGHAIHVGHGEDADDAVAAFHLASQHALCEIGIAPKGAIGQHHAFREARRSTCVVDEGQLVGALLNMVVHMFFAEIFREALTKHLIQMLACKR